MQLSTLLAGAIACAVTTTSAQSFATVTSAAATPIKECTSTITVFPTLLNLYTDTVYEATITETDYLDCRGCNSLEVRGGLAPGPIRHVTATVTEDYTITTELACFPTDME